MKKEMKRKELVKEKLFQAKAEDDYDEVVKNEIELQEIKLEIVSH